MGNMISGTYTGNFIRWVGKEGSAATVKITLSGNEFNGHSDSINYPSICSGVFKTFNNSDSINFINQCDFPANID